MAEYQATDGKIHNDMNGAALDLLPLGCVLLTPAQAAAIRNTPEKIKADFNAPIFAAIAVLEATISQRVWREAVTKPAAVNPGTGRTAAAQIAYVDAQCTALRATLQ